MPQFPHLRNELMLVPRSHRMMGSIGLAKKFVRIFHTILRMNPNELFGQHNKLDGFFFFFFFNRILTMLVMTQKRLG